jgi:hypothetical protein
LNPKPPYETQKLRGTRLTVGGVFSIAAGQLREKGSSHDY